MENYEERIRHLEFMLDLSREREASMSKRVMECEYLKSRIKNLEILNSHYDSEIEYLARMIQGFKKLEE
tara:strand:+ start:49280 stop:49486 length:207 start_codon:yes stop_codon:yes gene_type:complete